MRRLRIILIVVFLSGVLLGGAGAGLTMVEWSSLRYMGTKLLGSEHLVTENFDFEMKDDGSAIVLKRGYYSNRYMEGVEEDPSVPEGVVRFQVTYNSEWVEPFLDYTEYDRTESEDQTEETASSEPVQDGELYLRASYFSDSFQIFMENKDAILDDLKAGRLSSYTAADITGVKIRVNPVTMYRVVNRTGR